MAALRDIHGDLAIAENTSGLDGRGFLSELRVSSPDIIRILAVDAQRPLTQNAVADSAVYQYVRKPLDPQLIGLVVKRAREARELARRHRLLSREFKVSSQSLLLNDRHGVMFNR